MPKTLHDVRLAGLIVLVGARLAGVALDAGAQPLALGPLIPTWGPNGTVGAMALDGDVLYVGGDFDQVGPATGSFAMVDAFDDTAITSTANLRIAAGLGAMVSDGAGGWFVAGTELRSFSDLRSTVDHVLADGTRDSAWIRPTIDTGGNVLALAGNRLFVGGRFATINGAARRGLAALDAATGALLSWDAFDGQPGGAVTALGAAVGRVFVAGTFDRIGGADREGFAVLDAGTGTALPPVLSSTLTRPPILGLSITGSRIYLYGGCRSGGFVVCAYDLDLVPLSGWTFPAAEYPFVATETAVFATRRVLGFSITTRTVKLDPTTGAELPWNPPLASGGAVNALAVAGNRLYLGGEFSAINGEGRRRLAAVDSGTGTLDAWAPLVGGSVTALGVSGDAVAFGGFFRSVGGAAKHGLVSIDLRTGRPAVPSVPDLALAVTALVRVGDVMIVAGTRPFSIPPTQGPDVVAFSTRTGALLPWSLTTNGRVSTLAVDGRRLYVGGDFSLVADVPRLNVAAVEFQTQSLTPWTPAPNRPVRTLKASSGALYAAGDFTTVPGHGRPGVVAWDPDTGAVLPFNPGARLGAYTTAMTFYRDRVLLIGQRADQSHPFEAFEWVDRISGDVTPPATSANFSATDGVRTGDTIYVVGDAPSSNTVVLATIDASRGAVTVADLARGALGGTDARVAATDDYVAVGGAMVEAAGAPVHNLAVFRGARTSAPRRMTAVVSQNHVTLGWQPGLPPAASFLVEAGSTPGAADLGVLDVGPRTHVTGTVPAGTYHLRVRAAYPGQVGSPSSEVVVTVPTESTPPDAPGVLSASLGTTTVMLSWGAAAGNATTYVVEAGTGSGLSDVAVFATGNLDTALVAPVPRGTYYVRVRAANAFGHGPPSNEVVVVVP